MLGHLLCLATFAVLKLLTYTKLITKLHKLVVPIFKNYKNYNFNERGGVKSIDLLSLDDNGYFSIKALCRIILILTVTCMFSSKISRKACGKKPETFLFKMWDMPVKPLI